jgi:predicted oxidoreductase
MASIFAREVGDFYGSDREIFDTWARRIAKAYAERSARAVGLFRRWLDHRLLQRQFPLVPWEEDGYGR